MGRIKSELEDLSFRHLHPREFEELQRAVNEKLAMSGDIVERIKDDADRASCARTTSTATSSAA